MALVTVGESELSSSDSPSIKREPTRIAGGSSPRAKPYPLLATHKVLLDWPASRATVTYYPQMGPVGRTYSADRFPCPFSTALLYMPLSPFVFFPTVSA